MLSGISVPEGYNPETNIHTIDNIYKSCIHTYIYNFQCRRATTRRLPSCKNR